jgi:hypothetical protein
MAGTVPIPGNLSMANLAATITSTEQLEFKQLTALTIDSGSNPPRNLGTFINQPNQLGELAIVAAGTASTGTKLLSTKVNVLSILTSVDLYRLPLEP